MADALKRITAARDKEFQDRVSFYMWHKANTVLDDETPNADDLSLAKAIIARQVNAEDMTMVVITNSTVGAKVDAGNAVLDSEIERVVVSDTKFHDLAEAYKAAGVIE
jgi:hypothetical protein